MIAARTTSQGLVLEVFGTDKTGLAGRLHPDLIATLTDAPADTRIGDWIAGPPASPATTPMAVRAEAERRMMTLLGARDATHLGILVVNVTREMVRLLLKGGGNWSEEESDRARKLKVLDEAIEAIRAASNAMEADLPADYQNDVRWPGSPRATDFTASARAIAR